MILPQEIIRKKRDGGTLSDQEVASFIEGLTSGAVTEMQASAFAMAVFFKGMSRAEAVALTQAMMRSGTVLDWSALDLDGPVLDKHSTGGVGDLVSLILAPALAACGAYVPMISGRGLGHTGGTLDKLDAIPGYTSQPDNALFRKVVGDVGCAIIGQTGDLAPADKKLYAIRDVTATVESIPLITASILSKKLAAGLQGLVMDVKTGSGAFMPSEEKALELAHSIVSVANGAGLKTTALITDMNEPLAPCAGNGVEVMNAIENLTGKRNDRRLMRVTVALGGELLVSAGIAQDRDEGRARIRAALTSGRAAEKFAEMVAALGGPRDIIARAEQHLAPAPIVRPVKTASRGVINAIDTRQLGLAVVALGGGRTRAADPVDHAVGLTSLVSLGADVSAGVPLAMIHARSEADFERAAAEVRAAYRFGERPVERPLILRKVAG